MPQIPVNKHHVTSQKLPDGTLNRASYFNLHGVRNKPEWPGRSVESPLDLTYQFAFGCVGLSHNKLYPWLNGQYISADAPNMSSYTQAHADGWDQRLYAGAYAKFFDAAKQGSSEWAVNIVQGRQTLSTFIQLSLTSATTIAAFCQVHKRGLDFLRRNPDTNLAGLKRKRKKLGRDLVRAREAASRRRLSNELWLLDQISGTLLAYRYGVAPLMADIASTADILSKEFSEDVTLRKAASRPWGGKNIASGETWTGKESVVLKATVATSNPNLQLANRLGIINPATIAWELVPWSFVVDWWFPVGKFLSNFTASVGLSLSSASVTRTRAWSGIWTPPPNPYVGTTYSSFGDMRFSGKRKNRTLGSLPVPLTVPYGSGLGIQRGQNALALIAQKLKTKVK